MSNINQIADSIAFDLWVGNDDRSNNPGNLLISTESKDKNIILIDYGNSFKGPDWCIDDLVYDDIIIPPFDGEVYTCLKNMVSGIDPFNEICTRIESLSYHEIDQSTMDLPSEWGLSELDRTLIVKFLDSRKLYIRKTMSDLINEFPNWRR